MRTVHVALALSLILGVLALACGKKGPPLPPLEGMTPRVIDLEVRQAGRGARATFTLPIRPDARLVDYETRGVELWRRAARAEGSRPVAGPQPFASPSSGGPGQGRDGSRGAETPMPPAVPRKDFVESATLVASVSGGELFDFLSLPVLELIDPSLPSEVPPDGLEYAVILKTDARSSGTVSNLAPLKPLPAPAMPADVKAEAVEGAVRVSWTPALTEASDSAPEGSSPARSIPVNIYRALDGAPFGAKPVEGSPFESSPFTDDAVVAGSTHRYVLRSVSESPDGSVESDPSAEVGADYRDVFPPAAPKGLRVIPEIGRVNLVWNPSPERDLGGYHAYRRPRGGDWQRLDTEPIPSATFIDRAAPLGQPLEYAVTAHDRAVPPNESEKSAAVAAIVEADQ